MSRAQLLTKRVTALENVGHEEKEQSPVIYMKL